MGDPYAKLSLEGYEEEEPVADVNPETDQNLPAGSIKHGVPTQIANSQ